MYRVDYITKALVKELDFSEQVDYITKALVKELDFSEQVLSNCVLFCYPAEIKNKNKKQQHEIRFPFHFMLIFLKLDSQYHNSTKRHHHLLFCG